MDLSLEEWRPVVGYEGHYEVSSLGRVKSVSRVVMRKNGNPQTIRERVLTPYVNRRGYTWATLSKGSGTTQRSIKVHALVAAAFLGPRPEGNHVLHGPNGISDNSVSNLSYGTQSENLGRDRARDGTSSRGAASHFTKLNEASVLEIRARLAEGVHQHVLAAEFGVTRSCVGHIKAGRAWAWLDSRSAVRRQYP